MEMNKEEAVKFYELGWTLSEDDQEFPKWFEFHYEKIACLLGFNDEEFKLSRTNKEIVEEVLKLVK